jgi:hypothetical protein
MSAVVALLVLVVVELLVASYAVTRIVGKLDFYLVEWISAVGLMMWIAFGAAVIPQFKRWLATPRGIERSRVVGVALVCAGAVVVVQASAHAAVRQPSKPDPELRTIVRAIVHEPAHRSPVVLELGDTSAWPVFAATTLELEQEGHDVQLVRSSATQLLFPEDSLAASRTAGSRLTFFDARRDESARAHGAVIAHTARWRVERCDERCTQAADSSSRAN